MIWAIDTTCVCMKDVISKIDIKRKVTENVNIKQCLR